MKIRHLLTLIALLSLSTAVHAQRERLCIDQGWMFTYGHAADFTKDYGCGTEYFNYLTKANSIHNEGPYSRNFKPGEEWKAVDLPHDWVVDLGYSSEASFSHGHKTVGWKYPETSVGWYRKTFTLEEEDKGKHFRLQFDGIFRDARIWVNGFYVATEPSGYCSLDYDITDYLLFGGEENLICVRCDASLEEGWYYEGAGIYRHAWLQKTNPLHVATDGTFVHCTLSDNYTKAHVTIETEVSNDSNSPCAAYVLEHHIIAPSGDTVASVSSQGRPLQAREKGGSVARCTVTDPALWDTDNPNLYNVVTDVYLNGSLVDRHMTRTGFREVVMDCDEGLFINGKHVKIKGFNMHQDHAGVGAGIPDGLQRYRIDCLKWMGGNAYRSSHNPMSPAMLDVCDEKGILVFEETRLVGINDYHISLLQGMIKRDRNHPSVILWGVGNEEWGIEWDERGVILAETMKEYAHRVDSTRLVCAASSGGPSTILRTDVSGYNYIKQHDIDGERARHPERIAVGSEETTGCGTRGVYFPSTEEGRHYPHNLNPEIRADSVGFYVEKGWTYYNERPWLMGLFFWTGLDYRGEPNPMKYPATGSLFGVMDYCGFPKDEAYYLKSWWGDEPVLHIMPHWNLEGHEGDSIKVYVFSNCDEVALSVNGRKLGRKAMPENGHLEWDAVYEPGNVTAVGYRGGKVVMREKVETAGEPCIVKAKALDYDDITVVNISVYDRKGRFVPTACIPLEINVEGDARILGFGNGDSAFQEVERPVDRDARTFPIKTFNGLAQVIIRPAASAQRSDSSSQWSFSVCGEGLTYVSE